MAALSHHVGVTSVTSCVHVETVFFNNHTIYRNSPKRHRRNNQAKNSKNDDKPDSNDLGAGRHRGIIVYSRESFSQILKDSHCLERDNEEKN